jgi:hypothetical protein
MKDKILLKKDILMQCLLSHKQIKRQQIRIFASLPADIQKQLTTANVLHASRHCINLQLCQQTRFGAVYKHSASQKQCTLSDSCLLLFHENTHVGLQNKKQTP